MNNNFIIQIQTEYNTVKPVLNGPFIKRNFVLNGNIFRSLDYHKMFWTRKVPFKTGFTVNKF
jgi:hypothetical protein